MLKTIDVILVSFLLLLVSYTAIIESKRSMNVAFDKLEKVIYKNQNEAKKLSKKVTLYRAWNVDHVA